jgi:hypothetical protein
MQPTWLQYVMKVSVRMRTGGREHSMEGEGVFETMLTGTV